MPINRQFQNKHLLEPDPIWVDKQFVERDICLMYHQLATYGAMTGDLYYGSVYALPYWDFLQIDAIDERSRLFIRNGCLVMVLAMALEMLDDAGWYLSPHISVCRAKISALVPTDEDTQNLVKTVLMALRDAEAATGRTAELSKRSSWVYYRYVQSYFNIGAHASNA